jgi:hypothetical protein
MNYITAYVEQQAEVDIKSVTEAVTRIEKYTNTAGLTRGFSVRGTNWQFSSRTMAEKLTTAIKQTSWANFKR